MAKRIISGVIGVPFLIAIVIFGGLLLRVSVLALSIIGLYEFYNVVSKRNKPTHYLGYLFSILFIMFQPYLKENNILILFTVFLISLFIMMITTHEKVNIIDCSLTFIGVFYVSFLLNFVPLVREYEYGQYFVWLIFISAWGSDTCAYFTGITIGKHKLCPKLSPKKTIEGSLGGIVGATILAVIYGLIISRFYTIEDFNITLFFAIITAFGAAFSQLGDLSASAIKRYTGTKDYGNLIPGHGGVLDRFDSILFTAPGVYIIMLILLTYL